MRHLTGLAAVLLGVLAAPLAHAQADTTTTVFHDAARRFSIRYPATWETLDVPDSLALAVRRVDVARRTFVALTAAARPASGSSAREIFDSLDDPDVRAEFVDGLAGRGHAHERERRMQVDAVTADTLAGQFAIRATLAVEDRERGWTSRVVAYTLDTPDRAANLVLVCIAPVDGVLLPDCEAAIRRLAFPGRARRR